MIGDSHAHVLQLTADWVSEAWAAGVTEVGAVAGSAEEMAALEALSCDPIRVRRIVGWHPEVMHAGNLRSTLARLDAAKVDAVGEIGWPHWVGSMDSTALIRQAYRIVPGWLAWAQAHQKPVVLHAVYGGIETMLAMLKRFGIDRALFHWHKGPIAGTCRALEAGAYVGVTPEACRRPRDLLWLRWYPRERILWETDAPWGHVGQPASTPADVVAVGECLSRLWQRPLSEVIAIQEQAWQTFWGS